MSRAINAIVRANRAGPPENSIVLRVAAVGAVVVSIAACVAEGELNRPVAIASSVALIAGSVFSYRRRANPMSWLKLVLAVAALGGFFWFFLHISRHGGVTSIADVLGPLALLFTWIQLTHSFDTPSRRDLGFTLAGSATLMAVAAAQAVDTSFAFYVLVWGCCCLAGLMAMWGSMAGGSPVRVQTGVIALLGVVVASAVVVAVLPAPHASTTVIFPSDLAGDVPIATPNGLVGGANGQEPVHAATADGATRVGGFLGFAGPLNTAVRGTLSNQVVLRVRADKPTFWIAETFNHWTGQSWVPGPAPPGTVQWQAVKSGSPFYLPLSAGNVVRGSPDVQTFYLAAGGPNLVFHAATATTVWFPAQRLYVRDDTILASTSLGPGSVYTVASAVANPTKAELEAPAPRGVNSTLPAGVLAQSTQLPHPYPDVARLARSITAGKTTTYAKVLALEAWIGAHTRYTTDIPPLLPGQDTVHQFLFVSRRGYCEQISTSLAVMLRTLGIPAREATGYVPGPYNPITDLYDVEASDAHAWVQVWFPGWGWQSFDPTAQVPLANPSPADALAHDALGALGQLPLIPIGVVVLAAGALTVVLRRRRARPATWTQAISFELLEAARRVGVVAPDDATLSQLAERLDTVLGPAPPGELSATALATAAEEAAYGTVEVTDSNRSELIIAARRLRRRARRTAKHDVRPDPPPGPRPMTPRQPAGAGRP